jgi:hypothetical protein
MERRAAIGAEFRAQMVHAEPLSARTALRVDALNRPTGQILQRLPLKIERGELMCCGVRHARKVGRIVEQGACGVKNKATISSRRFAELQLTQKGTPQQASG